MNNESTKKFFERIDNSKEKPLINTLEQLESILEDWEICYDETDGKYIIKNHENFNLTGEQVQWIYSVGLHIFEVLRYDETVKIILYHHKGFGA